MKKYLILPLIAFIVSSSYLSAENNRSVSQYNPFEEMQKMQEEMDKIFDKFHQRMMSEDMFSRFPSSFPTVPAIDLQDSGDNYLLKVDIPGVEESEITVTSENGKLTIKAKSHKEEQEKRKDFLKQERFEGMYMRTMTLPDDADAQKLKSEYKDGVLQITIPKKSKT